jgi:hypothetical protein
VHSTKDDPMPWCRTDNNRQSTTLDDEYRSDDDLQKRIPSIREFKYGPRALPPSERKKEEKSAQTNDLNALHDHFTLARVRVVIERTWEAVQHLSF